MNSGASRDWDGPSLTIQLAETLRVFPRVTIAQVHGYCLGKIAVQMGRDLSGSQAIQLDQLVGARLRHSMDPAADVEAYLDSQKGGPNLQYKRSDA